MQALWRQDLWGFMLYSFAGLLSGGNYIKYDLFLFIFLSMSTTFKFTRIELFYLVYYKIFKSPHELQLPHTLNTLASSYEKISWYSIPIG